MGKDKVFFSLVGLPRSGTTIFTNVLNSWDDTFCISEPIWTLIESPNSFKTGKIDITFSEYSKVLPELRKYLDESDYKFGGIKETYRDFDDPNPIPFINKSTEIDLKIYVLRDPACNFAGWKRRAFKPIYNNVDVFIRNYNTIIRNIQHDRDKGMNTLVLQYECITPEYILEKLRPYYKANSINLRPTGYVYGDQKANRSIEILPPNMDITALTNEEIDKLHESFGSKCR